MKIHAFMGRLILVAIICKSLSGAAPPGHQEITCPIKPIDRLSERCSHPHIPGPRLLSKKKGPSNLTSSTNWCGFVAANNINHPTANTVSSVSASWIVPTLSLSTNNSYCAVWVGIDGYTSSSVEQIGTSHNVINGVPQQYAWFEMYPQGSYEIVGFPLNSGDVISASVQYAGSGVFVMRLYNDTQNVVATIPTSYTTSLTASRSCAEWIVEAPYQNGILPLEDFGTAYLWGCNATINNIVAPINNTSWNNIPLEMVTNSNIPKAIPSSILQDNGSFFVTWQHQ